MRSDSGYGSGRSSTELTMAKMATLAPIPSASVAVATTAYPGRRASERAASLSSSIQPDMGRGTRDMGRGTGGGGRETGDVRRGTRNVDIVTWDNNPETLRPKSQVSR